MPVARSRRSVSSDRGPKTIRCGDTRHSRPDDVGGQGRRRAPDSIHAYLPVSYCKVHKDECHSRCPVQSSFFFFSRTHTLQREPGSLLIATTRHPSSTTTTVRQSYWYSKGLSHPKWSGRPERTQSPRPRFDDVSSESMSVDGQLGASRL